MGTSLGVRMVAARSILEQFERAKTECKDPANTGEPKSMDANAQSVRPDLLVTCENAATMAKELVQGWLEEFMFAGDKEASKKALSVADWLSDHNNFKSHARNIPRRALEDHGLKIRYLEDDPELHDLYLSVAHAAIHTFSGTSAVKIIENQHGKAYIKLQQQIVVQSQPVPPSASPTKARPKKAKRRRR